MQPGDRVITWDEVRLKVPFTRKHILELEKAGRFPKRLQLGNRRVAWVESEIDQWLAERIAERDSDTGASATSNAA